MMPPLKKLIKNASSPPIKTKVDDKQPNFTALGRICEVADFTVNFDSKFK